MRNTGWRKIIKYIFDEILCPSFSLSQEHGKIIVSVCVICLVIIMVNRETQKMLLPLSFKDTVGEIPIINHFDDVKLDNIETPTKVIYQVVEKPVYIERPSYEENYMVTTSDVIWIGDRGGGIIPGY